MTLSAPISRLHTRTRLAAAVGIALLISGGVATAFQVRIPDADSKQTATLPVRTITTKLETGYFARRSFTGRAVAGRTSPLAFEMSGRLTRVVAERGDTVEAGQLLAEIDTSRLEAQKKQVEADIAEVEANLKLANQTLSRRKELVDGGFASQQALDEAEANKVALTARLGRLRANIGTIDVDIERSKIRAPFAGTVTARMMDEGTVAQPGAAVLEVSELGRLEARIGLPPEFARAARDEGEITLLSNQRKPIDGVKIRSVVPVISGETRTMMVTFDLPPASVERGELITALIDDWNAVPGMWLPLRALSADVRGLWRIYKVSDSGHVRFENVQTLYTDGERVYVTGTLSNGDKVIADGLDKLALGQKVTIVDSMSFDAPSR